jgi:hypothetical protein
MAVRRAHDLFGGATTSAAVDDAEIHGALAAFHVEPDGRNSDSRVVWKTVAGGSYRFPVGFRRISLLWSWRSGPGGHPALLRSEFGAASFSALLQLRLYI